MAFSSSDVSSGDQALASQYNDLRADVLAVASYTAHGIQAINGTVIVIPHGMSVTPNYVEIQANKDGIQAKSLPFESSGVFFNSTYSTLYKNSFGDASNNYWQPTGITTSYVVYLYANYNGAIHSFFATVVLDATNITLTFNTSTVCNIKWLAKRIYT